MDNKSRLLVKVFFILMILSAVITFYRYMIIKDFEVIDSGQNSNNESV